MGSMKNRLIAFLAAMVMTVVGTTSVFGSTPYTPPPLSGTDPAATACVSPAGEDGIVFDGNLTVVGSGLDFTVVEFWWRGDGTTPDSPEYDTLLQGSYQNLYQPLAGTYWPFPVSCGLEQVMELMEKHIAARQADPTVNNGGFVPWEQTMAFKPVDQFYVIPDPGTDDGFGNEDYEDETIDPPVTDYTVDGELDINQLCLDDYADELSDRLGVERNNRDVCNFYAGREDNCVNHQRYPLDRHPEISTSASYAAALITNWRDRDVMTIVPHGKVEFEPGPEGRVWEYGIFCTYDQVVSWVQSYMERRGMSPDALVDWQDIKFLNLDTYNIPGGYYGGTEDPDTSDSCVAGGEKRIFENIRGNRITLTGRWFLGSPWTTGKEWQIVKSPLEEGEAWVWDSTVKGSVWTYPGSCTREEVLRQARVLHNARGRGHSYGVLDNFEASDSPVAGLFRVVSR